MTESRVAARYAKSLLDLAQEMGTLPAVAADMQLVADTLAASRELRVMLTSPVLKSDKKLAIITALFTGKMSEMSLKFFILLAQKGRDEELAGVADAFLAQYRTVQGIQQAHLTTATTLTAAQRAEFKRLAEAQTGKHIELLEQVDPTLIGGFVLRIGDRQIDDSVASSLQRLRTSFADQSYVSKM
ncbi:MAG: ATP synthase F1 subunit delta [Hymenobacteraceae bacterium]|nr:ATP synthase F1 subunit delta [Hymenobacteraceae bacterium]